MSRINLKDAALADDNLSRQGFRCDELAPKTSSGDSSVRSNGGMHLRGVVQSAGLTLKES